MITGHGINADVELCNAFVMAGSEADRIHVNDLISDPKRLLCYDILAFPGGFSFGDHIGSGVVFANLFKLNLKHVLQEFVASRRLVIGICNGFQVLVKMGFLPNISGTWEREVSLIHNDSGKFEDRWVTVRVNRASPCVWTRGCTDMELPVRHGEGKFVAVSSTALKRLQNEQLVVLRYAGSGDGPVRYPDNPNGSVDDIAGICDPTGKVLGLMPHPEAFVTPETHPSWTRGGVLCGEGLLIFRRGVEFIRDEEKRKNA